MAEDSVITEVEDSVITVDRAIQTGTDDEDNLVQISSSLKQLLQRITSYQRYKRFQLDVSNQVEFCHNQSGITCARTDVTHFRRSNKVKNAPVKMQNMKGPVGKPLLPLEQFQRSLLHEQKSAWDNRCATHSSINLLHLPNRVSNIEQYLSINQGGNKPRDLLTRVAQLEMRLLAIEGQSYEYGHAKVGNKSVPQPM